MGVSLLATVAAALVGATIASLVKLPAAPLLGAMIGVGVLKVASEMSFDIPSAGRWIIYCAVGWLLGQTVTREALATLRTAAVPVVVSVAYGLWRFTDLDIHTALLASAPGGIAQMGVLSAEANANVPVVLAVHVLRITSVIVLMSVGLRLMGGRS